MAVVGVNVHVRDHWPSCNALMNPNKVNNPVKFISPK